MISFKMLLLLFVAIMSVLRAIKGKLTQSYPVYPMTMWMTKNLKLEQALSLVLVGLSRLEVNFQSLIISDTMYA